MIVRDQNRGQVPLAAQIRQQRKDFFAGPFIQIAGWLVGQQQGRIAHQRARDGHALLLAAGEFTRAMLGPVRQPDFIQPLFRLRQRLRPIRPRAPDAAASRFPRR